MIELQQVTKSYGAPGSADYVEVLRGIDLRIGHGQSMAVMGPSGSGKSTLLNLIGTLDEPSSGRILWEGQDLAALSERDRALFRNRYVGFIFQMHHLLPQCTAIENVLLPTLASGSGPRQAQLQRAKELLAKVGLEGQFYSRPGQLSGGQRQRVAVARAMINRPRLLLADEPTGSLDTETAQQIVRLLVEVNATEAVAIVVVTHAAEVAARFQSVYTLRGGLLAESQA